MHVPEAGRNARVKPAGHGRVGMEAPRWNGNGYGVGGGGLSLRDAGALEVREVMGILAILHHDPTRPETRTCCWDLGGDVGERRRRVKYRRPEWKTGSFGRAEMWWETGDGKRGWRRRKVGVCLAGG